MRGYVTALDFGHCITIYVITLLKIWRAPNFSMNDSRLIIHITTGTGEGQTELSAFDSALLDAGIGNFNLIQLSSIIPPNSEIREDGVKLDSDSKEYGNFLYVVYSEMRVSKPGDEAWAGIGWVRSIGSDKRGLFVEHHGCTKQDVLDQIHSTLDDMTLVRDEKYGSISHRIVGIKCTERPVCAIVAAPFTRER
jgi:arginine decarboxylase